MNDYTSKANALGYQTEESHQESLATAKEERTWYAYCADTGFLHYCPIVGVSAALDSGSGNLPFAEDDGDKPEEHIQAHHATSAREEA